MYIILIQYLRGKKHVNSFTKSKKIIGYMLLHRQELWNPTTMYYSPLYLDYLLIVYPVLWVAHKMFTALLAGSVNVDFNDSTMFLHLFVIEWIKFHKLIRYKYWICG
jgi:hypothetical protein